MNTQNITNNEHKNITNNETKNVVKNSFNYEYTLPIISFTIKKPDNKQININNGVGFWSGGFC